MIQNGIELALSYAQVATIKVWEKIERDDRPRPAFATWDGNRIWDLLLSRGNYNGILYLPIKHLESYIWEGNNYLG